MRIVFIEVLPQLDEHELRDVLRVLCVADDAVAETVDLGGLAADELFESVVVASTDCFDQLTVVEFNSLFGRNHQSPYCGHRDTDTKAAQKTSNSRFLIPVAGDKNCQTP